MKILITDDDYGWLAFHADIIEKIFEGKTQPETVFANCAAKAYDELLKHADDPFDLILTDLQMEDAYSPKTAGEWLVEQIKTFPSFKNTKIIIISAMYNIEKIADDNGVEFIRKSSLIRDEQLLKLKLESLGLLK